jgi:hypothetical protein
MVVLVKEETIESMIGEQGCSAMVDSPPAAWRQNGRKFWRAVTAEIEPLQ